MEMAQKKEEDDEEPQEAEEGAEEGQEEGEAGAHSPAGRKRLLILIVLAVLLVVGGTAGAYFMGLMDPLIAKITGREVAKGEADVASKETVFMDLPELLVNLNTGGRRTAFLKMKVTLEVERKDQLPTIEKLMPRIVDNFQIYLREIRIEDLRGSAGLYRLREEMLQRVNAAAAPAKVTDVLFKELLIQ